jgi:uncharacterized protein (DUF2249 family)
VTTTSEIHIDGTDTDPQAQAQIVLRRRNAEVLSDLAAKITLATELDLRLVNREQAQDTLLAFGAQRLRHHLLTTDQGALFGACQHLEKEVLLPALAVLPGVDLPGLVEDVTTLLDGGTLDVPEMLDVREIPHGRRHPRIFGAYARLAAGQSFVLVNNHDPKPLRREFQATYPDRFGWDYLEAGPDRWQVRITRLSLDA